MMFELWLNAIDNYYKELRVWKAYGSASPSYESETNKLYNKIEYCKNKLRNYNYG